MTMFEEKYTASIVWNWIWSLGGNNTRHFCQKASPYCVIVNGEYK